MAGERQTGKAKVLRKNLNISKYIVKSERDVELERFTLILV